MIRRSLGSTRFAPALLLLTLLWLVRSNAAGAGTLETEAERSDYKATSTYAQVVDFCQTLAKESPVVRLGKLGTSHEGRELPLVIIADPPVATPAEAAASKKLVFLAIANIHAGEVDGKEALLMLARDLAMAKERPLLKDLVIVLAPIFNADGNEKFGNRRPTQAGPPQVGTRENAQQFDLNRDFVKLESPEVRGLVDTINAWDPAVFMDLHTTNGSYHQYTITYEAGRNPAGDPRVIDYARDSILPTVTERMEQRTGYKSFFYGNFAQDHKAWETISPQPRFGIHYVGLRNRIAILSESYTYAPFKDRVLAGKAFVEEILQHTVENQQAVREMIAAVNASRPAEVALKYDAAPIGGPRPVHGFVEERRDGRTAPTSEKRDYESQYLGGTKVTHSVKRPHAYLVPASFTNVIENLKRHGIHTETLPADVDLAVETYKVDGIRRGQTFQKHVLTTLAVSPRSEKRAVKAGTVVVKTDQPLGSLAACLLEPQSSDGLVTWNFFDDGLAEGQDFPVLRLIAVTDSSPVEPQQASGASAQRGGRGGGGPVTWLEDGEHYLQTSGNRVNKVNAATGQSESLYDTAKIAEGLRAVPALSRQAQTLAAPGRLRTNAQRTAALIEHENDLYFTNLDGTGAVRLTNSPTREEESTISPDGKYAAYVRGNNLYLVEVATQTERQVTQDGSDTIFNGKASWVYYEEVFGRTRKTYWWSPDSRHIAFLRFDDEPVRKFVLQDPTNNRQRNESAAYPVPGAPNPNVTVGTISLNGEVKFVDLSEYSDANRIVTGVGWTPDGHELYCFVQNRQQTWLDLVFYAPSDGKSQKLLRQTSKAWVQDPGELKFLPGWGENGKKQFLISSEATGWKHFELWDRTGTQPLMPAAAGEWEERTLHHFGGPQGWIYFSSSKDYGLGSHLYRMKAGGEEMEKLTREDGEHRINMSPNGKYYIDSFSNVKTPPSTKLYSVDGQLIRTLEGGSPGSSGAARAPDRSRYELVQIKTPDGFTLDASILYPPNFDEKKTYPVWYMTYAGPRSAQVRDRWGAGSGDEQYARLGFIVFHCDPRSASNKGAASVWTAYQQLGVQEMKDIESAIGWLNEHPFIDSKRIGMSGTSYGGFMTAYAMTHSKLFAAGIAAAPVTDWHNYDSIYTERYMNTPEENPDGYNNTSVVKAAANLSGRLLLVHGLLDDNVHPLNSLQLAEALQRANKDFEMMIYPRSRHGGFGSHYQRLSVDFMTRNLKPERAGPPTEDPTKLAPEETRPEREE